MTFSRSVVRTVRGAPAALCLLALLTAACDKSNTSTSSTPVADSAKVSASASAQAAGRRAPPPRPGEPAPIPAPADVATPPADAEKTASGLASKVQTAGTGKDRPGQYDKVKVHYTGWTSDGRMFDSSIARGQPTEFGVNEVIPGWTEGLQLMVVGEKRRMWIPGKLAYGDQAHGGAPSGQLTFDVELLEIKQGPKPPPVPEDVKAAPDSAKKTKTGIAYRVLTPGTGKDMPKAADTVKVHYSGWTPDGKMFDSSVMRGEPTTFPLSGVIPGWTEGVQLMHVGDKVRFWIPAALAYGDTPKRPGAPAGPLVFDIELLEVVQAPKPPPVPEDVKAAPASAKKTKTGLAYRVLTPGKGKDLPKATDTVKVHYSGWTPDGKMFDSSVMRGEPTEFPLNRVIPGWTEGVQLMHVGDKVRFWIPSDLAYGDPPKRPGAPGGPLVFDIELLEIKK